ncbi:class I SAM-dependent methyltransferase [Galbibacter pacificus]|uniref:Class I SAM-dependent methyltransferase n=1 Tax=Galbibacter pacificus TaxID=2996052 RepID=A0ABT6FRK3_9FLAO|nr:class I SAM-dependent methyltransferase [Galbibacter pacificus]MDG3582991.1 class I SAM-dependent methyltransferase [Galbibacter pacificus]MDG3585890.1 class I SAM-dependent methyltransferase [Galbibacter pacificus]
MSKNNSTKTYIRCKDHLVSNESFNLKKTEIHGLLQTTPQPQPEEIGKYYESQQYISHTDSKKNLIDKIYQWVKSYSIKNKHNVIKKYHPKAKSLLDIGSGTGDFIKYLNKYYNCFGTEPNKNARKISIKKGNTVVEKTEDLPLKKFDVITLWHVFEHLHNPEEELRKIKSLLSNDGILIIAVPNYRSYDAKHYKENWAAYDVPRHLWHFDKTAMETLLGKEKFFVVKILPLIFDSFYVSLLSEKIKSDKNNYIKAFISGLKSNCKAKFTGEYSSLVYLCRKS